VFLWGECLAHLASDDYQFPKIPSTARSLLGNTALTHLYVQPQFYGLFSLRQSQSRPLAIVDEFGGQDGKFFSDAFSFLARYKYFLCS
jgi:hypothetical protein